MCRSGEDILSFGDFLALKPKKKTDLLFKMLIMVLLFGTLGVFVVLLP